MRAILIDDEPLALQYLQTQLNKTEAISVIKIFTRFEIHKEIDLLHDIDLVFLDIEMPEMNGIEMAERILEVNPGLLIVFVTAYNEYAIKAFELNALDYLLKPVSKDRLLKTIERLEKYREEHKKIAIPTTNHLNINVCSDLTFYLSDKEHVVDWRTAKSKELFLYLLLNKDRMVHKSLLVDLLWEDLDLERALQLLYTTIYHIRRALKPFNNYLKIINKSETYMLTTSKTTIDLKEWESKLDSLTIIEDHTVEQIEQFMKLYTDPYLIKLDYEWAEAERFRLEQKWISISLKIGTFYYDKGHYQNAESWLSIVCQKQPENEDANLKLMKLYAKLNYGLLVSYQYERLKSSLDELGLTVSPQVEQWFKEWTY